MTPVQHLKNLQYDVLVEEYPHPLPNVFVVSSSTESSLLLHDQAMTLQLILIIHSHFESLDQNGPL